MRIEFEVIGEPKPQGSKRLTAAFGGDKKPIVKNGRLLTRILDDNPKLSGWRQEVAYAARRVYDATALLNGPVNLSLNFCRPRPKSHFGTGRNAGVLKAAAPKYPTQRPDTLKLARAIEDALTGVIWHDDSQVCRHVLSKDWGEYHHVLVVIETLDDLDDKKA